MGDDIPSSARELLHVRSKDFGNSVLRVVSVEVVPRIERLPDRAVAMDVATWWDVLEECAPRVGFVVPDDAEVAGVSFTGDDGLLHRYIWVVPVGAPDAVERMPRTMATISSS